MFNCMKRSPYGFPLVFVTSPAHSVHMVFALLLLQLIGAASGDAFGVWRTNRVRSSLVSNVDLESLILRIEPHRKGEIFTVDRVDQHGRTTTSSSILYLDDKPRSFQDVRCSGTQASRKLDHGTVEILRQCGDAGWTRFIRRLEKKELVLEITEQKPDGQRFQRLVLQKQ